MPRGKQCLPFYHLSLNLVTYHHKDASIPLGEVSRESCSVVSISGPTDELYPSQKAAKPVWV